MTGQRRNALGSGPALWAATLSAAVMLLASCGGVDDSIEVTDTVTTDSSLPQLQAASFTFHGEVLGSPANPTLVALHGGPGADYRSLQPLSDLADAYQLVLYDHRGAGLSPRVPAEDLTLDVYIADLHAIIQLVSPDRRVHLLGHSFGGQLATAFVARYPELVDKLVLVEPGPMTQAMAEKGPITGMTLRTFFLGARANMRAGAIDGPDEHAADDWIMGEIVYGANPDYWCSPGAPPTDQSWRFGSAALRAVSESLHDDEGDHIDLTAGLEGFAGETLFIAGECNTVIGEDFQREQAAYFENADVETRVEVIAESGHQPFLEQPAATLEAVRGFLAE